LANGIAFKSDGLIASHIFPKIMQVAFSTDFIIIGSEDESWHIKILVSPKGNGFPIEFIREKQLFFSAPSTPFLCKTSWQIFHEFEAFSRHIIKDFITKRC